MVKKNSNGNINRTVITRARRIIISIFKKRMHFFCTINRLNRRIMIVLIIKVIKTDEVENNIRSNL